MTATQEVAKSLEEPPVPIIFTDSAATKVADLIAEEGNFCAGWRMFRFSIRFYV